MKIQRIVLGRSVNQVQRRLLCTV